MKQFILSLLVLSAFVISAAGQTKIVPEPAVKRPFAESLQAVVVTTKDWNATQGTAQLFERRNLRSGWTRTGTPFPIVVGRNGLAWALDSAPERASEFKKEGDGKAPAGAFPLTSVFGNMPKPEQMAFPYTKLEETTECVDDAASSHYNTIVDRIKVGNFDWKSSEKMLEIGEEYGLGVFVAYNSYPVRKGDGSCIFLHVWKDAATPTSGCTAMERRNVERIASWIETERNPYLIQLPRGEYKKLRKAWNLPKI